MAAFLLSRFSSRHCLLLILLLALTRPLQAYDVHNEEPSIKRPFVIGAISNKAKKHIKFTSPLANYLATRLSHYGYGQGKVVVVQTINEMAELLRTGQVDLVSETLFSVLELQEKTGAKLLLKRWKNNADAYSSVIFVRKDSNISSLDDLRGKIIAFEDRASSSGYFLPVTMLLSKGYELHSLSSPDQPVPEGKIGYVFAKDILKVANEISISSWVYRRVVDAGAFSNLNWDEDEDMPWKFRSEIRILLESDPYPRNLLLARPSMEEQERNEIKQILLTAHTTKKGKKALKRYQKTSKFEELDKGSLGTLHKASTLKTIIKTQLLSKEN